MNGAQSLIQTLVNGGVDVCFTNPGTSEMHFVAAVDKVPGMCTVLGLFEGVCTGAADGYGRMAGKLAATLLHLGPGLGNGFANLHNAKRAGSPIVNIVGDHATYHLRYDAPLTSDIESVARPVSAWVHSSKDAVSVPADGAAAIAAAMQPPGQIATLILPGDCTWEKSVDPAPAPRLPQPTSVDSQRISEIASILRNDEPTMFFMSGTVLMEHGLHLASRIGHATNSRLMCKMANGRIQRGAGRAMIETQPYPVEQALKAFKGTAHIILVGTGQPVNFFAFPDTPSTPVPPDCQIHTLATPQDDPIAALGALIEELHVPDEPGRIHERNRPPLPTGPIDPPKVWATVSAFMPEHSVIAEEAVTSGRGAQKWMAGAPPYDEIRVTGGAIGNGLPMAVGAAVACPDRKILNMQADGSAMYTVQSLWTMARENLDIVTVLFSNRAYAILQVELQKVGADGSGPKAQQMLDLGNPDLDWCQIANGMGVEASQATTAEEFASQFESAVKNRGPRLIEVIL
ncbi:acetolactate synthase large subunit [Chloroflexi bacterium TSY]|nr:acetolactate synthase large subunit [Chloroflexi bacterium TSY]